VLLVDTGDMLPPLIDGQGRLKGEVLGRAYALMGYDAITLGEVDLYYGPQYLAEIISGNGLPVISLNISAIVDSTPSPTKTGMPPCGELTEHPLLGPEREPRPAAPLSDLPPYVIKESGGAKVAFVGLLNHRVNLPEAVTDSLSITPMEEGLDSFLTDLEERADVIVALAHAGTRRRARALADSFPQFDVVLAGHVEQFSEPYHTDEDGTVVAYVKSHGRFLGRLNLLLDERNKVIGFGHDMVPMEAKLGEHRGVLGLLTEYVDRLKVLVDSKAFRPTTKDLYIPPSNYVTAATCYECHAEQHEQWEMTGHAHAFDTLEGKKRAFDPECQKCHTTGFRFISGFVTPRGSPHMKHVQCEACHGPGGDHTRDPTGERAADSTAAPGTQARYGLITEASCTNCHTEHNSPEFDYREYLERVKHSD
jgi:2',3'-cyclic-nucleotide 2'-phosphodiesterase (5'-nucleotidase family)